MKVFCDCGAEMVPSECHDGHHEYCLTVATFIGLGKTRFMINALWYLCMNKACGRSAALIPDFPCRADRVALKHSTKSELQTEAQAWDDQREAIVLKKEGV